MIKKIFLVLLVCPLVTLSQRITYSQPESEDTRSLDFEVVGKVGGNFLVYKNIRNRYAVSVYDDDMNLKERNELDLPEKIMNADFIVYPDFFYLIYQYQKKSTLRCMAIKIDGNGKRIGEPIQLDTTHIGFFTDNKIYSSINSEDRQKIMIYKIQKKNDRAYFTTVLFNSKLALLHTSRLELPFEEHKDGYSDFLLDNEGNLLFTQSERASSREVISKLNLVTKAATADNFVISDVDLKGQFLDDVMLKVDNVNRRYLLNSFYYKQRRGNIQGLYTMVWDNQSSKAFIHTMTEFDDTLKRQVKTEGSSKLAFNDFFIRNIILKKDGSFIMAAEDFNTQSRATPWNRMDYLYGYPYNPSFDYYQNSPSSYWFRSRSFNSSSQTRYFYNNIVVMNVDRDGKLSWADVVHKEQYDDENDNYLSYQVVNAGGELHFLFNELERRNELLSDQSITADGQLTRNPTLKSLDKGYDFMPKYGKQVSAKQIIVPCTYRNYICFAKIDF